MHDGPMTPLNQASNVAPGPFGSPKAGDLERYLAVAGIRWLVRLLACLLALACVFHNEIGNSFSVLLGDALDGQIQTSILQHWYNVFRGLEDWNTTAYFYPWKNTLGYNDGYFIPGILFSITRFFGSDPFLASEIASIALRAIGFFAFEAFAVYVLAFRFGWALLGAVLFTLSNNITIQAGHGQLLTVCLAPLLGLLLWRGLQSLIASSGRRPNAAFPAILWGCSAALLYAAWLLSGFYMAWFMTLFVVVLVLAAMIQEVAGRGAGWPAWRSVVAWPLIPVGVTLAIAILPFLLVYLPKAAETGGHPFSTALSFAPSPLDFLHIGSNNLVFGGVDRWISQTLRHKAEDYGEFTIGFPPVLASLALAGAAFALLRPGRAPMLIRSIALATLISIVMLVRVGPFTLWYFIYHLFPGGSGVRVICRYALFLTFPVVLLAMSLLQAQAKNWPAWVIVAVVALLLVEEVTTTIPNIALDRANELRILAATPPPPAACRAFFVQTLPGRPSTGSKVIDSLYLHNVDAMMLAETLALPTLNGFSTFNPPDWNFSSVDKPGYVFRVARYVYEHRIESGLCGLDLARHVWTTAPALPLARLTLGPTVDFSSNGDDADQYIDQGFNAPDENGRLIDMAEAKLIFSLAASPPPNHDMQLQIDAIGQSIRSGPPPPLTVEVNGHVVATWHPKPGPQTLKAEIPSEIIGADNQLHIRLHVVPPSTSLFVRAPKGSKRLGLIVQGLRIVADPAGGSPAGSL